MILCDEQRLRQILINLVHNALKFTQQGRVLLQLTRRLPADGRALPAERVLLRFQVADTGVGITEQDQPLVFRVFNQSVRSNQLHGSGLGLSICKELVSYMGGELLFTSSTQQPSGSSFYFELPFTIAESLAPPSKRSPLLASGLLATLFLHSDCMPSIWDPMANVNNYDTTTRFL